jgi:ring-1,2-phenylacetyl-CoA epoxidase subunit PaaB
VTDTQWPRFEVFLQDRPGTPHRNIGSVHAPDIEMALMNARDVFVRRPSCISLWVVPVDAIYAKTVQEIEVDSDLFRDRLSDESPVEKYDVFRKLSQRRAMTYVIYAGQVEAASPELALHRAIEKLGDESTFVWWVCPERMILRSQESDIPSMFTPAMDKEYRQPRDYKVVSAMQEVKREQPGKGGR